MTISRRRRRRRRWWISARLVKALAGTHGALDVERTDVLPVFLQKRDQEVDGETDIGGQVVRRHRYVADRNGEAQDLLQLKFDGGFEFLDLGNHIVSVSNHRRELTGFVQTGSQNTGNLLNESIGGQERVVLLGELLHQFLILVQLLQRFLVHTRNFVRRGLITMLLITQNADGKFRPGDMAKLYGTRKTLLLLRIVILQVDLKFDGLEELPVLSLGELEDLIDRLQNRVARYFAHFKG